MFLPNGFSTSFSLKNCVHAIAKHVKFVALLCFPLIEQKLDLNLPHFHQNFVPRFFYRLSLFFCPVDRYTRTIPAAQPLVAWQNLRKFPVPYGHNNDLFLSLRLPPSSSSPKAGLSKVSANCLIRVDQVTPHNLVTYFPLQRLS